MRALLSLRFFKQHVSLLLALLTHSMHQVVSSFHKSTIWQIPCMVKKLGKAPYSRRDTMEPCTSVLLSTIMRGKRLSLLCRTVWKYTWVSKGMQAWRDLDHWFRLKNTELLIPPFCDDSYLLQRDKGNTRGYAWWSQFSVELGLLSTLGRFLLD